jgi:predicted phosphodiesterase
VSHLRLRILSDIHFAESTSRVTRLEMIRPLLGDADQILLNGDSVDTRFVDTQPTAAEGRERFLAFIAAYGDRLTMITGNHDPDISTHHHAEPAGGRILVTHGDVLFPSVAPWGWEAPHVLAARAEHLARFPGTARDSLEALLEVSKHSSYATRHLSPAAMRDTGGSLVRFLRILSRVRRADKILGSWFRTPRLAADLAAVHRPAAELVVIGHTHYPGVWKRGDRWVINTGAFTPPFRALAVDFIQTRVEIRAIERRNGEFRTTSLVRVLEAGRDLRTPFF